MESKCPVCGLELKLKKYEYVPDKYSCIGSMCWFGCNAADLPRIAAAMELAKAEAASSNAVWSVPLERLEPAIDASEDMLFQARMRVLEVFNG